MKFDRRPDLDPFWVADMDFVSPEPILQALQHRVAHGVFGYAQPHPGLLEAIDQYFKIRKQVEVNPDHLIHLGGLVPAISLAIRALCQPEDEVLTLTPVYPPFLTVAKDAQAKLVRVDLVKGETEWSVDWDALEAAITEKTKTLLLCSPHNPVGKVYSREEMERFAALCLKHQLVLISDEIHADLIFDETETPHVSGLHLGQEIQEQLIVLLAPSKTWNIAGLGYAFAVISNDTLRRKFNQAKGHTLPEINALSYYAAEAAYREGEPWREALMRYLKKNRDIFVETIQSMSPQLSTISPQATYLGWIDASGMGVSHPALHFEKEAGLFLSDGAYFGAPQYVRFNFGCPTQRMMEGLMKMKQVVNA